MKKYIHNKKKMMVFFFYFVDDYYYSVRCEICDAEVGIVDKDEIYVFFDVIASYG